MIYSLCPKLPSELLNGWKLSEMLGFSLFKLMYCLLSLLTWITIRTHRGINSERRENIWSVANISVSGYFLSKRYPVHNCYLILVSLKNVPDSRYLSFPNFSHPHSSSFNSLGDFLFNPRAHSALTRAIFMSKLIYIISHLYNYPARQALLNILYRWEVRGKGLC